MLFSRKKTVEDRIVELALDSSTSVKKLSGYLEKERGVSLRAVYKSVHKLIDAGVLLKVGRGVVVNQEWALRAADRLSTHPQMLLSDGERVAYTFTSIPHLDSFWKTTVLPLEKTKPVREVFLYNPHNFWAYLPARKMSEDAYYRHFLERKISGFFTVGGNFPADAEFKRFYQNDFLQIDLRDIASIRRTDHISILVPFIVTVRLSKNFSNQIDTLYASGKFIHEILPEIIRICERPGKIRFTLENNAKKAQKIKRILSRNFYFRAFGAR